MKTSPLFLAAFAVATCLFSTQLRADVVLPSVASTTEPIQFNFSGLCGDCPGAEEGTAFANFTQTTGTAVVPLGRNTYGITGEFTYLSGWFEIAGALGSLSFVSPTGLPGDVTFVSFLGAGNVISYTEPVGQPDGRGGFYMNARASGYYNSIRFSAVQGSTWDLFFDNVSSVDDFGSGTSLTSPSPSVVPEPSTWAMFGTGAVALIFARRRRSS